MALVKCPECKKKISDKCENCPNCGYPVNKIGETNENQTTNVENVDETTKAKKSFDIKSLIKKWWFWVAVGVVIVAITTTTILLLNRDTKPKFDKEGNPVFVELTNEVYTNAKKYKGYHINIKGQVFQVMSDNGEVKGIQIWLDPDTCEQNMMIYYNTDVEVKQGDYIMCSGYIDSVTEYKNAYDAKLYAPLIISSDLRKSTYMEVMAPAIETIIVENLKQEKYGYSVTIDKIEFAEKETRIYATVANNGKALLYFGDAVIVQSGKQYNSTDNYEAEYEQIPYEVVKGVSCSGIIVFPTISTNDFDLTISIHSDDYNEEIENFVFKVVKNSVPVEKKEETNQNNNSNPSQQPSSTNDSDNKERALQFAREICGDTTNGDATARRTWLKGYLMETGKFSESVSDYVVKNIDYDWYASALFYANAYKNWGKEVSTIPSLLANDGYTSDEINYACENADWNQKTINKDQDVISAAEEIANFYATVSPTIVKELLINDYGFDETQANYAVKNAAIEWDVQACWKMEEYVLKNKGNNITKNDIVLYMSTVEGFSENDINYAFGHAFVLPDSNGYYYYTN